MLDPYAAYNVTLHSLATPPITQSTYGSATRSVSVERGGGQRAGVSGHSIRRSVVRVRWAPSAETVPGGCSVLRSHLARAAARRVTKQPCVPRNTAPTSHWRPASENPSP